MKKKICTLLLALLFAALFFVSATDKTAYAEAGQYQLTYDKEGGFVTAETGERRVIYLTETLQDRLVYISYDRFITPYAGQTVSVREGKVTSSGATVVEDDVRIYPDSVQKNEGKTGKNAYYYVLPKVSSCCGYVFTVCYLNADKEPTFDYASDVLYVTKIDDFVPTIEVTDYYPSAGQYKEIFTLSDYSEKSAVSGLSGYVVYQTDLYGQNKKVYAEETFSVGKDKRSNVPVRLDMGKYNYYMVLTDNVGNATSETLIATFDTDALTQKAWSYLEIMNNTKEMWSDVFVYEMGVAYTAYYNAIHEINGEESEESVAEKTQRLTELVEKYDEITLKRKQGEILCDVQVQNGDYLASALTVENTAKAMAFVRYGDEASLRIGIGRYDNGKRYVFSPSVSTTSDVNVEGDFSEPLALRFSIGEYKKVSAVQKIVDGGEEKELACTIKEYADGTIVLFVPKASGDVVLTVERGADLRWLYLLFLTVPVGGGIAVVILYKKGKIRPIKKGREKEGE